MPEIKLFQVNLEAKVQYITGVHAEGPLEAEQQATSELREELLPNIDIFSVTHCEVREIKENDIVT